MFGVEVHPGIDLERDILGHPSGSTHPFLSIAEFGKLEVAVVERKTVGRFVCACTIGNREVEAGSPTVLRSLEGGNHEAGEAAGDAVAGQDELTSLDRSGPIHHRAVTELGRAISKSVEVL